MTEKEKQLFEIARIQCNWYRKDGICETDLLECDGQCWWYTNAENGYKNGLRKVPENAVVLTREEYDELLRQGAMIDFLKDCVKQARKETAKQILQTIKSLFNEKECYTVVSHEKTYKVIDELAKQYEVEVDE